MIELNNLSLRYADKVLFDNASAMIGNRDRIGLTGPNGSGKTTLLRILMGLTEADAGSVHKAAYASLGWLPQEAAAAKGRSVLAEVESAFPSITETRIQLEAASDKLRELDVNCGEYAETLAWIGDMEARLEHEEADKLTARIEAVLAGLGFSTADTGRDCGEFSGGWQMRIALAKLLMRRPTLLLLDEPTNHLDIASLHWLEKYLKGYPGALLIVSHDRAFLDQLTNRTFALSGGRIENYAGNFSFYEKEAALRHSLALQAKKKQDRMLAQTGRFIERFRYKSTKARQVQSRIKQLDKIERIAVDQSDTRISFSFPPAPRSGQRVLEIEKLHKAYGTQILFENLDFMIERGDRVAVVGNNGAGKSTLVRILAGEESFQKGTRSLGHNVRPAYFAQHQAETLDPGKEVLACLEEAMPRGHPASARDILGSFLFAGNDVFKKVSVLSGGEKSRLALARMLAKSANLLILDEPTNHLDMRSKDILREALGHYEGAFVVVSHDRDFLDPLVEKVFEVGPAGPRWFHGNLSYYLTRLDAESTESGADGTAAPKPADASAQPSNPKARRQAVAERNLRLAPLRKRADSLEKNLHALEAEQAELESALADPALYADKERFKEKVIRHKQLKALIESAYNEWEAVEAEIGALA